MQTFLPYESFRYTATCLDNRRLGKQRVEAKQILLALGIDVGQHRSDPDSGWKNHPAVMMWRGSEFWLAMYAIDICKEWRDRGYKDTLLPQFVDIIKRMGGNPESHHQPDWLGYGDLHLSHRSNLLRKMPEHYSQFHWNVPDDLPYIWPEGVYAQ